MELNPHFLFINSTTNSKITSDTGEVLEIPAGSVRITVNSILSLLNVDTVDKLTITTDGSYTYSDIAIEVGGIGE